MQMASELIPLLGLHFLQMFVELHWCCHTIFFLARCSWNSRCVELTLTSRSTKRMAQIKTGNFSFFNSASKTRQQVLYTPPVFFCFPAPPSWWHHAGQDLHVVCRAYQPGHDSKVAEYSSLAKSYQTWYDCNSKHKTVSSLSVSTIRNLSWITDTLAAVRKHSWILWMSFWDWMEDWPALCSSWTSPPNYQFREHKLLAVGY